MMEWARIDEFPGYSVSDIGEVRNDRTGRYLSLTTNQAGIVQVGLVKGGSQYKRSVAVLVAKAFLDPPMHPRFNTPINLDGDRSNNRADNLMWRPRWFAVKYHKQFDKPRQGLRQPIREKRTGEIFPTSWEAAIKYGLLDRDILIATLNRTYVIPTYQEFELVAER